MFETLDALYILVIIYDTYSLGFNFMAGRIGGLLDKYMACERHFGLIGYIYSM